MPRTLEVKISLANENKTFLKFDIKKYEIPNLKIFDDFLIKNLILR